MEFHFFTEAEGVRGDLVYSTDLYYASTISNMLSIYRKVLEEVLNTPSETAISQLPLLTTEGYSQLDKMGFANAHYSSYPESSVVDIFRQEASCYPNRVAVKDPSSQLTYAQLDRASDRLSGWLLR